MQIKTITTAAGINEIDFDNDGSHMAGHFYWFKNLGDSILYVSAKPNPVTGADDVSELPVKGAVSIETDEGTVYILGAGKVEIHRTNSKFCPFELPSTGSGGDPGPTITIDDALSDASDNPVQNKVITGEINGLKSTIEGSIKIDDTSTSGTNVAWSANKLYSAFSTILELLGGDPNYIPLIPILSNNTGANGKASSNSAINYNGTYGDPGTAYYAFDGNNTTNVQYYSENTLGGWVQYEFNTPVKIDRMTAYIGGYAPSNVFKFWFQYYDDNTDTWKNYSDELTCTGTDFSKKESLLFEVLGSIVTSKIRLYSETQKMTATNWIVYTFQAYSNFLG